MDEYSEMCKERFEENESKNPNGSGLPFVQISKDLKWIEIVVTGVGPIYKKKIGSRDPSVVETEVLHHGREHYRFDM